MASTVPTESSVVESAQTTTTTATTTTTTTPPPPPPATDVTAKSTPLMEVNDVTDCVMKQQKQQPTPPPPPQITQNHGKLMNGHDQVSTNPFDNCSDPEGCVSIQDILKSFNAPISEEQAWSLIYKYVKIYRDEYRKQDESATISHYGRALKIPCTPKNFKLHKDGTVHVSFAGEDIKSCTVSTQKKILSKLGILVYTALDYNLPSDEDCIISSELEHVINFMTYEDADDEGIERDSEDVDEEKSVDTKELDHVLELCTPRVSPRLPDDHYRAVCRALATESTELRIFLQKVFHGEAETLRLKADTETSRQELEKLRFSDWARFWMQVVDELRRGVALKKSNFNRTPVEYELTPYEILMEDIRSRKYNLRKVMVNGDIPHRVKKDAHAVILEFIRSRPPLKKASERKLPPLKKNPSAREQLLDSIRKGRVLKPTNPRLKMRLLTSTQAENIKKTEEAPSTGGGSEQGVLPRNRQRLIEVDFSLFQDDDLWNLPPPTSTTSINDGSSQSSQPNASSGLSNQSMTLNYAKHQLNHHNNANAENNPNTNNINAVLRRTRDTITHDEYHRFCDTALETYDLATQCESRRASQRRHTIVGCQSNIIECHSMPPSRPESRQSEVSTTNVTSSTNLNGGPTDLSTIETWSKNSLDEKQWKDDELSTNKNDRLSLTLEEIVHIRSVMTKADLEGLPFEIKIKEDVEKRKVCFLCLRTRFSIFGQWGVQCKLCQKTVCSKCYSKMRIPSEHFRNVPVVLLSPSLMNSPTASGTPSPSHHAIHHGGSTTSGLGHGGGSTNIVDMELFPRSLMERLLRPESDRKTRHTIGSAPSSPKHQRSTSSTPGASITMTDQPMTMSLISNGTTSSPSSSTLQHQASVLGAREQPSQSGNNSNRSSIMSRSMEGPRSLPPQSPARPHSNNSTLDRRNRFQLLTSDQKEGLRGELMAVCNDCRGLVLELIRSSRHTRSPARNIALKNLTLDLSPVYKRW